MTDNIISIENHFSEQATDLKKLLKLVSPSQRNDTELQRLILFRLKLDGFDRTRAYLVDKTRAADKCGFNGRLYDYLKDDKIESTCEPND
ncbi:MAG: hypothetical protein PVI90_07010 [Desulfobacteraceae bacterium]|jgi:hypothetical protein